MVSETSPELRTAGRNPPGDTTLNTSTRALLSAFVLTKIIEIAVVFLIAGNHEERENAAYFIGSAISIAVFLVLVMVGTRQSLPRILAATAVRRAPLAGNIGAWLIISIVMGVVIRLGMGGVATGVFEVLDPTRSSSEYASVVASYQDPSSRFNAVLVISFLVGAIDEELCFRKIMQWHFCRRFGLIGGILGISIVFGAMHRSFPIALVGICLALLYVVSGRLWVAIIAHTVGNLTFPLLATLQIPLERGVFFAVCYMAAALLIAAMLFAVLTIRRSPPVYD